MLKNRVNKWLIFWSRRAVKDLEAIAEYYGKASRGVRGTLPSKTRAGNQLGIPTGSGL
jgi:plasmid stabilization system protein ParE